MRKAPKPAVRPSRPLGRYGGSTSTNAGGGTLNGEEKGAAAGSRSNAMDRESGRAQEQDQATQTKAQKAESQALHVPKGSSGSTGSRGGGTSASTALSAPIALPAAGS